MMWLRGGRAARYRQVVTVLARHGFGFVAGDAPPLRWVPLSGWLSSRINPAPGASRPEHLRLALEQLGTTFIKLGQILSTRSDLLPEEYIAELSKLRDSAAPLPFEAIRAVVEAELGRPLDQIFARFDPVPLASASIGQVHAARLPDGQEVVVKAQRPGVTEQVETDLAIVRDLAGLLARYSPFADQYDFVGLADEFAWTLLNELDYLREGRSADTFRAAFSDTRAIYIPKVFWRYTTRRVIVLERVDGIRIDDVAALDAAGYDRHAIAVRSAKIILREVFELGLFHADPHPGNFVVLPGGVIGAFDFGMVGRLDDATMQGLLRLLLAVVERDADRVIDGLGEAGVLRGRFDRPTLRREIQHLLDRYLGLSLAEIVLAQLVDDLMRIVQRHRLRFPTDLALLLKTLVMNEGVGRTLDPSFNMLEIARPYAQRALTRMWAPDAWLARLRRDAPDLLLSAERLPRRLERLLTQLERGDLTLTARLEERESDLRALARAGNRLAVAVLFAALIVALALLLQVYRPPVGQTVLAFIFAAGFLGVGSLVIWLLLSLRGPR